MSFALAGMHRKRRLFTIYTWEDAYIYLPQEAAYLDQDDAGQIEEPLKSWERTGFRSDWNRLQSVLGEIWEAGKEKRLPNNPPGMTIED